MSTHLSRLLYFFTTTLSSLVKTQREKRISLLYLIRLRSGTNVMNPTEEYVSLFWRDAELGRVSLLILWLCQTMMAVCGQPISLVWIQAERRRDSKTLPLDHLLKL